MSVSKSKTRSLFAKELISAKWAFRNRPYSMQVTSYIFENRD